MSNYNTQRYRAEAGVNPHGKPYVKFIEHDEGECVKYEDHAITCAELEEAKIMLAALEYKVKIYRSTYEEEINIATTRAELFKLVD